MLKKSILIVLLTVFVFGTFSLLKAEDEVKKIAVLQINKVDSKSDYVAKNIYKRDFKRILKKNDSFELLRKKDVEKEVEKTGYTNLFYMGQPELIALGETLKADILIWGEVVSESSSSYNVKLKYLSVNTKSINEVSFRTGKKSSERQDNLKKNLISKLKDLGGAEIEKKFNLAKQQIKRADYTSAVATLNDILKIEKKDINVYLNLGFSNYKLGNYSEAEKNYRDGLQIEPENTQVLEYLGQNYKKNEDIDMAIETYTKKAVITNDVKDWNKVGVLYESTYETTEAVEAFKNTLAIEPKNKTANYKIALLLYGEDLFEESLPYLETASNLDPDDSDLSEKLGKVYLKTNKIDSAIKNYKSQIEKDENNSAAYKKLATSYQVINKYNEAIKTLKKLDKITPDNAEVQFSLGNAYLKINKNSEALAYAKKGKKLDSNSYKSYFIMSSVYSKWGYAKYEEYLELDKKSSAGKLFGKELDELIEVRDNTKKKSNAHFVKAMEYINIARSKTNDFSAKTSIKEKKAAIKQLLETTKESFFD